MLVHKAVEKSQASGLASERAISHTGEPYMSSIAFRIEAGYHTSPHKCVKIMYLLRDIMTHISNIFKMTFLD